MEEKVIASDRAESSVKPINISVDGWISSASDSLYLSYAFSHSECVCRCG